MSGRKPMFSRQDLPPQIGMMTHVLKVVDKQRITVCAVSTALAGYWSHWYCSCSYRCTPPQGTCKLCKEQKPRRWCGFLHVCNPDGRGSAFLELTPLAAERIQVVKGDRPNLRGMLLHVWRQRGVSKSPLCFDHVGEYSGAVELPTPRDPEDTLRRLWKVA